MKLSIVPPSCRHTPEKKAQRPPLCLMPFGGGQRICIGRKIASVMYKMTVRGSDQACRISISLHLVKVILCLFFVGYRNYGGP